MELTSHTFLRDAGLALALFASASVTFAQNRPPAYSTHDFTVTGAADSLREGWADVKTPWGVAGQRRSYTVGTVTVRNADPAMSPMFSGAPISVRPLNWPTFFIPGTAAFRQVVVVQCVEEDQTIAWQRYFYGDNNFGNTAEGANARAIAVWPADTEADTRIAICGELYENTIPLEAYPGGAASLGGGNGFIAVYDGAGNMLWTHHLFGPIPPFPFDAVECAVTDLCIRREGLEAGETPIDIVTYCGASTYGSPAGTFPLSPVNAFTGIAGESDGSFDQGAGQWDGFVGRVTQSAGTKTIAFHSTVSGPEQDGLFGIAELSRNRFVAVGSANIGGPNAFPGTGGAAQNINCGVVCVFDASAVPGLLVLEGVTTVGAFPDLNGFLADTHLRDVLVGFNANTPDQSNPLGPGHMIFVAGSTNNNFTVLLETPAGGTPGGQFIMAGPNDGLVVTLADTVGAAPSVRAAAFVGGPDEDGLTGISGWNEYSEHFTVTGWTGAVINGSLEVPDIVGGDVLIQSFVHDSAAELFPISAPPLIESVTPIREAIVGGTTGSIATPSIAAFDKPAAMGRTNVMVTSGWDPNGLFDPAGGGIAVNARARATVCGTTFSDNFPVFGGGRLGDGAGTRLPDAIRFSIDLLPLGIGRTDGTGDPLPGGLPAGFTGGTSPACGLGPFGIQIGGTGPGQLIDDLRYPLFGRMLCDYEGTGPDQLNPIADASILYVRTPSTPVAGPTPWEFQIVGSVLELGFPAPAMAPGQVELWTGANPVVLVGVMPSNQVLRQRLVPQAGGTLIPIPPGIDLTVQLVCLVTTAVPSDNCMPGQLSTLVAGPALWIDN